MKKTNKVKDQLLKRKTKKVMHRNVKKGGTSFSNSLIESTPIMEESKPLTEKAKQTAQSIYNKMAQNPEAALGIATIGATMLAVPLILTLAG